jgi:hypothetical protein
MARVAEVEGEQLRLALTRAAAARIEPKKPLPISS